MSNVDFQNGFICGMATKGLTVNQAYSNSVFVTIAGKQVKLTLDNVLRTYSVLAFINGIWTLYTPRHKNNSIIRYELEFDAGTNKELIPNKPRMNYELSID